MSVGRQPAEIPIRRWAIVGNLAGYSEEEVTARVFVAMGATVGPASEREDIPRSIQEYREIPAAAAFVLTYLPNQGSVMERLQNRFGFREVRSMEYLDSLAKLIEDVVGADVRRTEKVPSLDADVTQSSLQSVDDLESTAIDW